jgi:hypothetical protein
MRNPAAKIPIDLWPESDTRLSGWRRAPSRANSRPACAPPTPISY